MTGPDAIRVGMGVDQKADRPVRDAANVRPEASGRGGVGQTVDHDHVSLADDDSAGAVRDEGGCRKT
jgi:hypothetical protein